MGIMYGSFVKYDLKRIILYMQLVLNFSKQLCIPSVSPDSSNSYICNSRDCYPTAALSSMRSKIEWLLWRPMLKPPHNSEWSLNYYAHQQYGPATTPHNKYRPCNIDLTSIHYYYNQGLFQIKKTYEMLRTVIVSNNSCTWILCSQAICLERKMLYNICSKVSGFSSGPGSTMTSLLILPSGTLVQIIKNGITAVPGINYKSAFITCGYCNCMEQLQSWM